MNRTELQKLEDSDLLALAKNHGVKVKKGTKRSEIIKLLLSGVKEPSKKKAVSAPAATSHSGEEPPAFHAEHIAQGGQQEVEESKFYTGVPPEEFRLPSELPYHYGDDSITLMVRDPHWTYSYWEVSHKKLQSERGRLGEAGDDAYLALRIYDVTEVDFDGLNDHGHYDIGIYERVGNWYINTGMPGRSFIVDLGLKTQDGRFITLARSNSVRTPRDSVSDVMDEEWMVPDSDFERIFALSGGLSTLTGASSADVRILAGQKIPFGVSSPGMGSLALMSSPSAPTAPLPCASPCRTARRSYPAPPPPRTKSKRDG
jgi:hypothetical protein